MRVLEFVPVLLAVYGSLLAAPMKSGSIENAATLLSSNSDHVEFRVRSTGAVPQLSVYGSDTTLLYTLPDEGLVYLPGLPILPSVSRFVIVPPDKGLELRVSFEGLSVVSPNFSLSICRDEDVGAEGLALGEFDESIFPAHIAEMSDPVVIRGVRMVKVTTYPMRYDFDTGTLLIYDQVQAEVLFTDDPPVNPAVHPNRRHRSREFLKFLDALVVNSDLPGRDDPGFESPFAGHYLIVGHERCMQYARPFIEWRRKCGYKVDQLSITANDALNEGRVKELIQARYDTYLDEDIDPFDNILLLGDRTNHYTDPRPNWILDAYRSESVWPNDANHADYLYATLEGNDAYPDVAFSRFASGGQNLMELAVAKTLAYEVSPFMGDPSWFRRGGAFSQHWGNNQDGAWHPSIHTNVRWMEEVLKSNGYDDIVVYENFNWDHEGDEVGPEVADLFNAKANMVLGRIQNNYWRWALTGVDVNNVFPFYMTASGHGEAALELVFRVGTAQEPRGAVATCSGWGDPPTAPTSALFMEFVKAFLVERLSMGWSRNFSTIDIETIFPNIRCAFGASLYLHVKTDFDFYGDPAIKPWFGVPRVVDVDFPARIGESARRVDVTVFDEDHQEPVEGAQVTFYDPGNMPDEPEDYLEYDGVFSMTDWSDEDGKANFVFPEDHPIVIGGSVFVTVTGDDIRPFVGEIQIEQSDFDPEIAEHNLTEIDGNGDDFVNPGETFELGLTVVNYGSERLQSLMAEIVSEVSWIEIITEAIEFGEIDEGNNRVGNDPAVFRVLPDCPDGLARADLKSNLLINLTQGDNSKQTAIALDPRSPCFAFESLEDGVVYSRGENELSPIVRNVGRLAGDPLAARLISRFEDIRITRRESSFGRVNPTRTGVLNGEVFEIEVDDQVVPGSKYELALALSSQAGFRDTVRFMIEIEEPDANTPTGPDKYGYSCFDDTDQEWEAAPAYDWVEINPNDGNAEFDGTALDFDRQSRFDIGEAIVCDVGFITNFYGLGFDRITVASNGFVAMGSQPRIVNFQNWPMDKAIGGGMGMIAPLWDDLRFNQNSWIGTFLDEDEHRLIVEWYRMSPASGNGEFSFQIILYDAEHYPAPDHNQPILFQYKTVSEQANIRNGDSEWVTNIPYASVGISSPFGDSGVNYVWKNIYPVSSAHLQNRRALRFVSHGLELTTGYLFGRVVDLESEEPLADARLFTDGGVRVVADDEGNWSMHVATDAAFTLTASHDGFNDSTLVDLSVEVDDTMEVDFALRHPEITISVERFEGELALGEIQHFPFTIGNEGNGILNWNAERKLTGEIYTPWDYTLGIHCGRRVEDTRIEGVIFTGENFYVAGANGADPNWIYILDREGEPVGGFAQPGVSNYGMKDLAWDGEAIFGSGADRIFSFDVEGNSIDTLDSPLNPAIALAWDNDRGILWCSGYTSRIFGLDRDGNVIQTLDPDGVRKYGLAYRQDDPDEMGLYLFARDVDADMECVWKVNPDENRYTFETYLEPPEGGTNGGASITTEYDPLHTMFICISNASDQQGGDRIDLYSVGENLTWMELETETGEILPGEEVNDILRLRDGGLPAGEYEGIVSVRHNGSGGRIDLPVALTIVGEGRAVRRLSLHQGWNLISLSVRPDIDDIPQLLSPLVEAENLLMIKDGRGRFFRPDRDFSNMAPWDVSQGYQIIVRQEASLNIAGNTVAPESPIALSEGWNMISYYPVEANFAEVALAGIAGQMVVAKDGWGRFYLPEFGFSNMEQMSPGNGYQVMVTQAIDLVYQEGDRLALNRTPTPPVTHFKFSPGTGPNMSLLVLAEGDYEGFELGAFDYEGTLLGAGRFDSDRRCGLAIWGSADLPRLIVTNELPANEEFPFRLRLWNGSVEEDAEIDLVTGDLIYKDDGLTVAHLRAVTPMEFCLMKPFPNPFNNSTSIIYLLAAESSVELGIYSLAGRLVELLVDRQQTAGRHQVRWDATNVSTGVYFVRLQVGGAYQTTRVLLIK